MVRILGFLKDIAESSDYEFLETDRRSAAKSAFDKGIQCTFTTANARTGAPVKIEDADKSQAWFTVPTGRVMRNGTMHIILAVTDNGKPPLTRYQRVIVDVKP